MKQENTIKVWDLFIRTFHWSLVIAFVVAYITEEELLSIHTLAGYVILGLLSLRLVWGLIGTHYARFTNFTYSLASIRHFLSDTLHLRARRYIGHNPAGGAMIFLLIASLLLTSFSGLAIYAASEQAGPLVSVFGNTSDFMKEPLEESHEFIANFTVLLVFIHILGVLAESLIHRENLVASMVSGYKRVLEKTVEDQ